MISYKLERMYGYKSGAIIPEGSIGERGEEGDRLYFRLYNKETGEPLDKRKTFYIDTMEEADDFTKVEIEEPEASNSVGIEVDELIERLQQLKKQGQIDGNDLIGVHQADEIMAIGKITAPSLVSEDHFVVDRSVSFCAVTKQ